MVRNVRKVNPNRIELRSKQILHTWVLVVMLLCYVRLHGITMQEGPDGNTDAKPTYVNHGTLPFWG